MTYNVKFTVKKLSVMVESDDEEWLKKIDVIIVPETSLKALLKGSTVRGLNQTLKTPPMADVMFKSERLIRMLLPAPYSTPQWIEAVHNTTTTPFKVSFKKGKF